VRDDVIDVSRGVVVEGQTHIPAGARATARQVVQMPMPKVRRSERFTRSFESVDGNTYTFRTRDSKGNPLPGRVAQTLYLGIVEQMKGGNPLVIFEAMGLKLIDVDGQQVFPVPPEIWNRLAQAEEPGFDAPADDDQEFSLGG
jgi:hypothetical protein